MWHDGLMWRWLGWRKAKGRRSSKQRRVLDMDDPAVICHRTVNGVGLVGRVVRRKR